MIPKHKLKKINANIKAMKAKHAAPPPPVQPFRVRPTVPRHPIGVPDVLIRLKSKFDGFCKNCGAAYHKDDPIGWNPAVKGETFCAPCSPHAVPPAAAVSSTPPRPATPTPPPKPAPPPPPPPKKPTVTPPKYTVYGQYGPASGWKSGPFGTDIDEFFDDIEWTNPNTLKQRAVKTAKLPDGRFAYQLDNGRWFLESGAYVTLKLKEASPKPTGPIIGHTATTPDLKALVALEEAVVARASKAMTKELEAAFDRYNKIKARALHVATGDNEAKTALRMAIIDIVKIVF